MASRRPLPYAHKARGVVASERPLPYAHKARGVVASKRPLPYEARGVVASKRPLPYEARGPYTDPRAAGHGDSIHRPATDTSQCVATSTVAAATPSDSSDISPKMSFAPRMATGCAKGVGGGGGLRVRASARAGAGLRSHARVRGGEDGDAVGRGGVCTFSTAAKRIRSCPAETK